MVPRGSSPMHSPCTTHVHVFDACAHAAGGPQLAMCEVCMLHSVISSNWSALYALSEQHLCTLLLTPASLGILFSTFPHTINRKGPAGMLHSICMFGAFSSRKRPRTKGRNGRRGKHEVHGGSPAACAGLAAALRNVHAWPAPEGGPLTNDCVRE